MTQAEYIAAIDELIPEAELLALEKVGTWVSGEHSAWCRKWDAAFHAAMDELAFVRGLRTMSHQARRGYLQ